MQCAAFSIVSSLRKWANETGGSVTAALLQPTPETFAQFDNVILLREGHIVYSGSVRGRLFVCGC